ncbi:MAG: M20/M25/M40 family metallo-hydrolase, partial [Myxococcales bacterium]|nr:M20/M25/M40 family metallo-hydrolase [Myxococcales bacterium]
LVIGALSQPSAQVEPEAPTPLELDEEAAIEHLAAAIRLQTVAAENQADLRGEPFRAAHDLLLRAYPCLHRAMKREVVADYSLLYTWEGSDPARAPGLFIAHLDVVPVENPEAWAHPPWAGEVADGQIWGRGAHDDKGGAVAILEAAEALCAGGFAPSRTLYFAVGHDEEVASVGAKAIAALLRERGVRAEFAVDEGMIITRAIFPELDPVALIGVAEKGFVSVELRVTVADGHSSMPPLESAPGILAAGLARLEADPFPFELRPPVRALLTTLAPEFPFGKRVLLSNLWLTERLVVGTLAKADRSRALLHTTTAITQVRAGIKENSLAREATATVNFRILPGDSVDAVVARTREVLDDPRIEVTIREVATPSEPSAISATDSPAYEALASAVRGVRPDALVTPALMIARTDSIHYSDLVEDIYRFRPILLDAAEIAGIHGTDEHIHAAALVDAIRIYAEFLRRIAGPA